MQMALRKWKLWQRNFITVSFFSFFLKTHSVLHMAIILPSNITLEKVNNLGTFIWLLKVNTINTWNARNRDPSHLGNWGRGGGIASAGIVLIEQDGPYRDSQGSGSQRVSSSTGMVQGHAVTLFGKETFSVQWYSHPSLLNLNKTSFYCKDFSLQAEAHW